MNKYKRIPARTTVGRKPGVEKKARPQSGRRRRVGNFLPSRRRRGGLIPRGPRRVDIMKIKGPTSPRRRRRGRRRFRRVR